MNKLKFYSVELRPQVIGIIGHAIGTFSSNPFTNKNWEERRIKEAMEKERFN